MNTAPFGLGAHPSPVDPNAWTPASVGVPTAVPDAAFIEQVLQLFITNQGKIGSCVGNTFEEIARLIVILTGGTQQQLSWRFVYAMCKSLEGTPGYQQFLPCDEGTYPALAAIVIRKFGVPLATLCPNDITLSHEDFVYQRKLTNIPAAATADALNRKSGADITFPPTEAGIKQAISYAKTNKGGVAILRRVGDTYWMVDGVSTYDKAKLLPIKATANIVSGHEELLYGYLDITVQERADLQAKKITIESLLAKYPETLPNDPTRTQTLIFWQNHWDKTWCSTGGNSQDGGRAWEFLDVWLPYIVEIRVCIAALPPAPDNFRYIFTKHLQKGDKGADVVALQHILDLEGCYDYNPTDGSQKYTGNYASVTEAGVTKLQEKYAAAILTPLHLTHGTGIVADATIKWLNAKYGITK